MSGIWRMGGNIDESMLLVEARSLGTWWFIFTSLSYFGTCLKCPINFKYMWGLFKIIKMKRYVKSHWSVLIAESSPVGYYFLWYHRYLWQRRSLNHRFLGFLWMGFRGLCVRVHFSWERAHNFHQILRGVYDSEKD